MNELSSLACCEETLHEHKQNIYLQNLVIYLVIIYSGSNYLGLINSV